MLVFFDYASNFTLAFYLESLLFFLEMLMRGIHAAKMHSLIAFNFLLLIAVWKTYVRITIGPKT